MKKEKKKLKNKTIKKPVIMLTISLILLFVVNNIIATINGYIDDELNLLRSREARILLSQYEYDNMRDELIAYLETNEHVVGYTIGTDFGSRKNNEANMDKYGVIHSMRSYSKELIGSYILTDGIDDLEEDEIIIPKYLTGTDSEEERKAGYVDGEQYIGDTITLYGEKLYRGSATSIEDLDREDIRDEEYEFTYKIVGVYDNIRTGEGYASGILSEDAMKTLMDSNGYIEGCDYYYNHGSTMLQAVVDDNENFESVAEDIRRECRELYTKLTGEESGKRYISVSIVIDSGFLQVMAGIQFAINFVAIFLLLCTIMSIYSYIREYTERRRREFGIMKAIGYRTGMIGKSLVKETILEMGIPLVITYIVGNLVMVIMGNLLTGDADMFVRARFHIGMDLFVSLSILVIGILVPLSGFMMGIRKIDKIEPMEALRSEE